MKVVLGLIVVALAAGGCGGGKAASVVGGYAAKFKDPKVPIALAFGSERLRISPDGTFWMFNNELKGTWLQEGDRVVLTPTEYNGQSLKMLDSSVKNKFGPDVAKLIIVFTEPFELTIAKDGSLHQGKSVRSMDEFDWERIEDPPLVEQLAILDKSISDPELVSNNDYYYYVTGIVDGMDQYWRELVEILESDAKDVRWMAASMLGDAKCSESEAVEALIKHCSDKDRLVSRSCQRAVVAVAGPEEADRLSGMIGPAFPFTRFAEYVKRTKVVGHEDLLLEWLNSKDPYDRQYGLEAFVVLPRSSVSAKVLEKARKMYEGDKDIGVRAQAAIVLLTHSDVDRKEMYRGLVSLYPRADWLEDSDVIDAISLCGPVSVPFLTGLLESDDWGTRGYAAEKLGLIGDRSVLPAIRAAFKDEIDGIARDRMFEAIKRLESD